MLIKHQSSSTVLKFTLKTPGNCQHQFCNQFCHLPLLVRHCKGCQLINADVPAKLILISLELLLEAARKQQDLGAVLEPTSAGAKGGSGKVWLVMFNEFCGRDKSAGSAGEKRKPRGGSPDRPRGCGACVLLYHLFLCSSY